MGIRQFANDEDGAITVDWLVLTAAVVGLVALSISFVFSGAQSLSDTTADVIAVHELETPGAGGGSDLPETGEEGAAAGGTQPGAGASDGGGTGDGLEIGGDAVDGFTPQSAASSASSGSST